MNKKSSIQRDLKQYFIDNLWFVILLAPLLIIAVMMFNHFKPAERQHLNSGLGAVVGSVEISTAELTAIVAKPLTELLAMEVYSVVSQSVAIATPIRKNELRQVSDSNLSEIKRAGNNPITVVSYAITEKIKTKNMREAS